MLYRQIIMEFQFRDVFGERHKLGMISVIIRCKDEEQWIGHSIQSVLDFLDDPEVIVIDNNSTDESMDVVRMFEHHVDINKMSIDDYSPGRSLNKGIANAKYEYILVISAHCVLTRMNWDEHRKNIDSHCVVFGKQIPLYRGRKIGERYIWGNFINESKVNMFCDTEKRYFLHNGLALYKKDTLIQHPFEEKWYGKEDRYWANSMISNGMSTLYDPSIECFHHWTPGGATWKGIG
jgi:glycosyltransferase involved in cell wall biosynthesis